jgi:hypothetical protein
MGVNGDKVGGIVLNDFLLLGLNAIPLSGMGLYQNPRKRRDRKSVV